MVKIVDTVEDRIQRAFWTAIDSNTIPRIKIAVRLMNASAGGDAISVTANSERGELARTPASFETVSKRNRTLHVLNANDESQKNNPDEVGELSAPGANFDRQSHTHYLVTGQTALTNQSPEFRTGCFLIPHDPPSHKQQNLSAQVSQDNNLPIFEQTHVHSKSDSKNSISCLSEAFEGTASQQRPQATTMIQPLPINTLILDNRKKNWVLWRLISYNAWNAARNDWSNENQSLPSTFTKRSIQKDNCTRQKISWGLTNCVSTKIRQTRITSHTVKG